MKNDLNNVSVKVLKMRVSDLENEILSLNTRIADVEWQYEVLGAEENPPIQVSVNDLLSSRRRAIDKKMHVINEIRRAKAQICEFEMTEEDDE